MLIDRDDIVCWRQSYLSSIKHYREEGKKIYYLDETWVNSGHTTPTVWVDKTVQSSTQAFLRGLTPGLKNASGKGKRADHRTHWFRYWFHRWWTVRFRRKNNWQLSQ